MGKLKPTAYIITRYGMRDIDDYEEYEDLVMASDITDKEVNALHQHGLVTPLYEVLDDMVLLPKEPTKEILQALFYSVSHGEGETEAYKAIIKAASDG